MNSKQRIFHILKQHNCVVSGETLSAELGISRVSVWKHVRGLVQDGIAVQSSKQGYRLQPDADGLHPFHFDAREERIHFFPETGSTMDEAMLLARQGCPAFTVVVAQRQTRGRGRMQRSWASADGGLFFTVVLRPAVPLLLSGLVNLAAAVDMAGILISTYGVEAGVKWPNDILVNGKKICGILSQMEAEGDQVAHLNIGMGLNVNNSPEQEQPMAVSLSSLLKRKVPRRQILTAFLDVFEQRMRAWDTGRVLTQWKSCNVTLGKRVRVETLRQTVEGMAVDLDDHGGLILEMEDGAMRTVVHGDCFHE
ncbi:MAG: biotin--[acetyl-CoA-carboxylase] ligase [Proteobacteria bacterium]|nr:MAG: biotin--[acetyl-CoA-carboxylase] ligase [Pseudomonadota bacterium]PIE68070.1 MAG: biotin--[acetyl-CoA-carboxylase] ligase [Deltaproteobacteria bacterium]